MNEFRLLTLVGGIIAAVGGLICGIAVIPTFAAGFDGGANIGAGLLLLLGVPVSIVGAVILLVAAIGALARLRRRVSDS
jgi:membrane protein implicated in regulation of membrane protease activity